MRRFGAAVRIEGEDFDDAKEAARAFAETSGGVFVEDGAIPEIAEGAGTIAVEMLAANCAADALFIPLGNGALAGGVATYWKTQHPATRIICVTAAGAPSMKLSFEQRRTVATDRASTIADGIGVRAPVAAALTTLYPVVDDVVEVTDCEILAAMRLLRDEVGLTVEPAGAAGLAAIFAKNSRWRGGVLATVLCGGNIDPSLDI